MKFSILSLGCKVNTYEADAAAEQLIKQGWVKVPFEEECDAAIVFTCAVTNMAASKSRKMLHKIKHLYPHAVTVSVGCYTQMNDPQDDADIKIGTSYKQQIPMIIETYLKDHTQNLYLDQMEGLSFQNIVSESFGNHSRAYLKIQDGCNQFCSYCIIPYVRGRERSMSPDQVISETMKLSKEYPEIVLTGIHTGRYGKEYGVSFTDIMERMLKETDIQRIRISSIEVTEITDEFIDLMKREPHRIARHLHIPLQSGSDKILKLMNRPYNTDLYYNKITDIRRQLEDISISCDLITGFPNESEEDFQDTLSFLNKCAFSFLHVFPYSARAGTAAADMKEQIDPSVKKRRCKEVMELSDAFTEKYHLHMLDHMSDVITEHSKDGITPGHTSEYIPVILDRYVPHGKMVSCILKEEKQGIMKAEIIKDYETE